MTTVIMTTVMRVSVAQNWVPFKVVDQVNKMGVYTQHLGTTYITQTSYNIIIPLHLDYIGEHLKKLKKEIGSYGNE